MATGENDPEVLTFLCTLMKHSSRELAKGSTLTEYHLIAYYGYPRDPMSVR